MTRWLKRIGAALATLALVLVALYGWSRWLGPTAEQERALAVMAAGQAPPVGRNAFAGLWLMPYDIPAGRRDEVFERDLRQYAGRAGDDHATFVSTADGRFADVRESMDRWPPLCGADAAQCLRDVLANRYGYAAWRDRNAALVERAAMDGFDHYRNPFAPRPVQPMPPFSLAMQVRRTSHALDFAQGRRQAALDGACHDIAGWRRVGASADTLLAYMMANSAVESSGRLFALMLARSPAAESLPVSCKAALAPPTVRELSPCRVMRGEFAYVQAAIDIPATAAYEPHMTAARQAVTYAQFCTPAMRRAVALDRPLPPSASPPRFGFDCIGNIAGCLLADIAAAGYRDYMVRMQGHGVRLRLLSTLYWLHTAADPARPLARRLASRPVALRSPRHPVEVVRDGGALRIAVPSQGEAYWQLPLNPALR